MPLLPIEAVAFCRRGHFQCAKLMRHHLPTAKLPFFAFFSSSSSDYPTDPLTPDFFLHQKNVLLHLICRQKVILHVLRVFRSISSFIALD